MQAVTSQYELLNGLTLTAAESGPLPDTLHVVGTMPRFTCTSRSALQSASSVKAGLMPP